MLAGCGGDSPESTAPDRPAPPAPTRTDPGEPRVGDGRGGVRLQKLGDFDQPLYVAQPPGERRDLFIVEKTGRIIIVRDGRPLSIPFLDLSDQVSTGPEQGLLSVAFAPDYQRSRLLYVDYTDTAGDTHVVEYRRSESGESADPDSAREVLRVEQPFSNHNGGLVLFGPDEKLYVGLGDGGGGADPDRNGLDLGVLLGKILRIDPRPAGGRDYSIPDSNPFTGQEGARAEIYSYGLRNPWRFSFDRLTEALSIGDVGQVQFEEIDLVPRGAGSGANFGWSALEGFERLNDDQSADGAVPPVLVYDHDEGCSVTGGHVVRDRSLPSLYGRYLYGDYCAGLLRSFTSRPGRRARDDRALGVRVPSLSSFGEDNAGHLYATSLDGPVYRLAPAG